MEESKQSLCIAERQTVKEPSEILYITMGNVPMYRQYSPAAVA
jgi:hypothetical protein